MHRKASEEVISLSSCGGSKSLKRNESSGSFFICALVRGSQPRRATRRRRIRLLRSSSSMRCLARSRSLSMISLRAAHPPVEISVLALQLHAAQRFDEELPIEARDASPLARAARPRGAACVACRREAAGPSEQPQGRERPRPPTQRASPGAMPARVGRPQRKSY